MALGNHSFIKHWDFKPKLVMCNWNLSCVKQFTICCDTPTITTEVLPLVTNA